MNTAVIITLIICGTLLLMFTILIIASLILAHRRKKIAENIKKDFFKEDRW